MERKINVIENLDGKKTVFIQDTMFKGRRAIQWNDVETYLEQYIDELYTIAETGEEIYIGSELPSEYTRSIYTRNLNFYCIFKGVTLKQFLTLAISLIPP